MRSVSQEMCQYCHWRYLREPNQPPPTLTAFHCMVCVIGTSLDHGTRATTDRYRVCGAAQQMSTCGGRPRKLRAFGSPHRHARAGTGSEGIDGLAAKYRRRTIAGASQQKASSLVFANLGCLEVIDGAKSAALVVIPSFPE
jgi:hypothetical protein